MKTGAATLVGFAAILLWSLLAVLTVATAPVPPFLLNAMCFAIGGGAGLAWTVATGRLRVLRHIRWRVYAFGTLGLFGYHALYFSALRMAPPAGASLVAYLWPLLIVLMSGLLPGERLSPGHVLGALTGFAGAALIVAQGAYDPAALPGYGLAFLCALTWSGYSVVSRRFGAVPTEAVTIYCLATAVLSAVCHMAFETAQWPTGPAGWLAILGLGLGPVGLAFFVWDIGVKRGDIRVLGAASYAAPVLSTLLLVTTHQAKAEPVLALSVILITAGAGLALRASRARQPPEASDRRGV